MKSSVIIMYTLSSAVSPLDPSEPSTATSFRPGELIVKIGDCPGGPLDLNGVELQEPEKGHCFDEMWGIKKGE